MPKRKQSENYDALGGVFDFIFAEARKPKNKRRPVKVENLPNSTDVLTDALVSSLASPATFMSDQIAREMNSALEIKLGSVKFNEDGELKFTTNNIIDVIKDPAGFVQKAIDKQKGARKAARAAFLGSFMRDFVVTGWAHQYGNADVRGAALANTLAGQQSESFKIAKAMGQSVSGYNPQASFHYDYMSQRSLDLIGRKTFGDSWDTMSSADKSEFTQMVSGGSGALEAIGRMENGARWATMTDEEKERYKLGISQKQKYKEGDEYSQESIQRYLAKKYGRDEAMRFQRATARYTGGSSDAKIDILDSDGSKVHGAKSIELYRTLEKQHLMERIGALRNAAPGTPEAEERRIYEKMLIAINMSTQSIEQLSAGILDLRSRISSERDPARKKLLEDKLQDSQEVLKNINRGLFATRVGEWEGYINSLRDVWFSKDGTGLMESIISGSFFRDNTLGNPVTQVKVGDIKLFMAKPGEGSKFRTVYNGLGENLYYLTPGSIFKTVFYNGEGFARMAYRHMGVLETQLSQLGFKDMGEDFFKKMMASDIKDYDKLIDSMMQQFKGKKLSQEQLDGIRKLLERSASFRKLGEFFGRPFKVQQAINKLVENRLKSIRKKIVEGLLNNPKLRDLLVRTGAEKLLGKWVVGGGIRVLIQSLVTAVVGALGMTFGPIASAITSFLTFIATDLLMKMLKYGLVILKYVALGILGVFIIIGFLATGAVGKFNKTNYSYSNATPGSVVQCTLYDEVPIEPGEEPWETPAIIPPNSDEDCLMGSQSIYCSQGYIDVACWSHRKMTSALPVDLTNVNYIYAPQFCDNGDCRITEVRAINCGDGSNAGGVVVLVANNGSTTYTFKLLHVQPLAAVGEKLSSGQPVALVQSGLEVGWCWTGIHLHLETKQNGTAVDPLELLQSFNCQVPDESGCSDSPNKPTDSCNK